MVKREDLKQNLPQWVLDSYKPEELSPHTVILPGEDNRHWVLRDVDFSAVNLYLTEKISDLPGKDRIFHGQLHEAYEEVKKSGNITVLAETVERPEDEPDTFPIFAGFSYELTQYQSVLHSYRMFLKVVEGYVANPDNIGVVHNFLNRHTMFWRLKFDHHYKKTYLLVDEGWETIDFSIDVRKKKKSGKLKTTVMLEAGGSSDSDRHYMYHDYNLDIYAKSIDAAYIELAAKIYKDYDEHGLLRDGRKGPNENFFKDVNKQEIE